MASVDKEEIDKERVIDEIALEYHKKCRGKLQILPRCPVRDFDDFAYWYTPGAAKPCLEIKRERDLSFDLTNRGNSVAIVTDGTRVLGLGDVGPEAALPIMEGKALLFKYLGGVDAFPLCLNTKDPDQIIEAVGWMEPTFGGINFEDIEAPKCFYILEKAVEIIGIPVWHDDRDGTATIILAGVINALKLVGKKIRDVRICLIGAGAANIGTAKTLIKAGARPDNLIVVDSKGILTRNRRDLEKAVEKDERSGKWKWELCMTTNAEGRRGGIREAMKDADVCISASQPGPGVIKKEWVEGMSDDPIIFACANPIPEIWPWEAKAAGAKIVATGRSDFPNQINNSLVFPGIFRGVLDVRARRITDEMRIAVAQALASYAEDRGINEENIVPRMDEWIVFEKEAVACALKAMEQGVARLKIPNKELEDQVTSTIKNSRDSIELLVRDKKIAKLDQYVIIDGKKIRLIY